MLILFAIGIECCLDDFEKPLYYWSMETTISKLTDQVLSLPTIDRVHLADRLLESLNAPSSEELNTIWAKEAERRIDELDSGAVQAIPGEKVLADIRKRLAK